MRHEGPLGNLNGSRVGAAFGAPGYVKLLGAPLGPTEGAFEGASLQNLVGVPDGVTNGCADRRSSRKLDEKSPGKRMGYRRYNVLKLDSL